MADEPSSGHTFRSLRVRNFRLYFAGQGLSQIGTWIQVVAVSLLVLDLSGSGVALGFVPAAQFLPVIVLGPWAGLLADRLDRHALLIGLSVFGTASAGTLAAVVLTDSSTLWWAYGLTLTSGVVQAMENPIRRALLSDLVQPVDVPNAVGLFSALMTSSRVVGPAIAGLVIIGPGLAWCFALNALSYVLQVLLLVRMDRARFRHHDRVVRARGQLLDGFRYTWRHPEIRFALLVTATVSTLALNYPVILPLLTSRVFGASDVAYTTLFSVLSVGSVVGALLIARRTDVDGRFLSWASLGLGLSTLLMSVSPNLGMAFALALPVGVFNIFVVSGANSIVQLRCDPSYRGRVLALTMVVVVGSNPIGGPLIGWVSEVTSARVGLAVGGVGAVGAGMAGYLGRRGGVWRPVIEQ